MLKLVILAVSLVAVQGWLFSSDSAKYSGLEVTFRTNPFKGFDNLPISTMDGKMRDFVFKDDYCTSTNTKFRGKRYWADSNNAVILLFDVNGYIAGIQTLFSKNSDAVVSAQLRNHPVIEDGDNYVLTAYFVDPSIICTTGRTRAEFDQQGTGSGIWLQNGTNPLRDTLRIPTRESEMSQTRWTKGKCVWTMGNHYWYNVREDMPCETFFPFCLLFNKGKLNGFCFAMNGYMENSRYDYPHPTPSVLGTFMKPVPQCFGRDVGYTKFSTMHVYLENWYRTSYRC